MKQVGRGEFASVGNNKRADEKREDATQRENGTQHAPSERDSPCESPLVPLNLVPAPIKHGTVIQSSPVPFNEAK
ncbi:hypothetical protein DVH24_038634 [Malus domestica]|uniref:Uncharacterized protein n=1 Tax=Malus domestica TaxID=3750 RepID=A0A498K7X4_MALDO|nr:hypothetical protein DVH24_038634 [Malus domestica]